MQQCARARTEREVTAVMSMSARARTERGPTASISVESSMLAGTLLDRTVRPDARVIRVPRADLFERGRGDIAAEVARLGRVDDDHDLDLGILGRQEADERGVVLVRVAAVRARLLGGTGLARDGVAGD